MEVIKQKDRCKVFLFEEPECNMHPGLQRNFVKYLTRLIKAEKMQFFLSTHSSTLIDNSTIRGGDATIFHVVKRNNYTSVKDITKNNSEKFILEGDYAQKMAWAMGYERAQQEFITLMEGNE